LNASVLENPTFRPEHAECDSLMSIWAFDALRPLLVYGVIVAMLGARCYLGSPLCPDSAAGFRGAARKPPMAQGSPTAPSINAEFDSAGLFAAILVSQPTLTRQLRLGIFDALDQRIATRYTLPPNGPGQVRRLPASSPRPAGRTDALFGDNAVARLPRALNNAAVATLIAAADDGSS
jgi:hypothetical protein